MKKLVLTAVLAAGLSQAAGCIITSDDTGDDVGRDPVITADINLSNAGPNPLLCWNDPGDPKGRDGIRVNARLAGTQSGFSDVYECTVVALQTPPLTSGPGTYDVWVDYFNDRGSTDPNDWVVVDFTDPVRVTVDAGQDIHAIVDLAIGNGFFNPIWTLPAGVTQADCDVSDVHIVSTISGTATAFDDIFDCTAGFNDPNGTYTSPLPLEDYTIAASLEDATTTLGTATGNGTILDGNEYVEMNIAFE
jgi:hypothetical protein